MTRREFVRGSAAGLAGVLGGIGRAAASSRPRRGQAAGAGPDPREVHRSTLVVNGLDPSALNARYLDLLEEGGVHCWHRSAGGLQSFADTYTFMDAHRDRIAVARSVAEIRRAREAGRIAYLFGWQSANELGDAPGEPPPTALRAYQELGLRICAIAYNVANIFGGGCLEPAIGLTRAGRRLVEEIHALRIVLDVGGHTGEQTSFDAIEVSAGVPVVCSHTNVAALVDNPRNTSDRLFEAIARTGGVIGLTAFNDFHVRTRHDAAVPRSPQVGLERHLDQFDHLRRLVGTDHIGLGPDFVEGRNGTEPLDRTVMPPEVYSETPWFYVEGFENVSQLPNVTTGLLQRGWSTGDVHKVLGGNWLRVYERVWGS